MMQQNQVILWAKGQKPRELQQLFLKQPLQNQRFQSQIRLPHNNMLVLTSTANQLDQLIGMAME